VKPVVRRRGFGEAIVNRIGFGGLVAAPTAHGVPLLYWTPSAQRIAYSNARFKPFYAPFSLGYPYDDERKDEWKAA
jgi:hypothetical protein